MFNKSKLPKSQRIETIIGKETLLSGTLESKGSVRIDGTFQGALNSRSDVIVGEDGLVQANISCINVILAGRVEGNIKTEGKLDIRNTGVLLGDAEAGSLSVEDGAVLTGSCSMNVREDKRVPAEKRGTKSTPEQIGGPAEKQRGEVTEDIGRIINGTGEKDKN